VDYTFYTADVFTDKRFCGNQLAVFPDAEGLSDRQMQLIAREINFSETVFVFTPQNKANAKQLRIFTPGAEVPFAGHPTVGTACILASLGQLGLRDGRAAVVFEEGVGNVPVRVKCDNKLFGELAAAQMAEIRPCGIKAADVAALLSLQAEDIGLANYPLQMVSCGMPFLFVPVKSLQAAKQAKLNKAVWDTLLKNEWGQQVYVFTNECVEEKVDFHVRMFAPALGIEEDPATGAAATAFGGYIGQLDERADITLELVLEQGIEVERPSKLFVKVAKKGGKVADIRVGGNSVLVSKGVMSL
jgi:trans-2,3-dihydro-3-hydroxyanthranilate isomerase